MVTLTREQAAAALATEPSLAIVAGAGTGKTRVLTERYLHLVLDRKVDVTRILALTFTEKAAREMKDRIREALAERGRHDLARASEFAPISTIHAFLARVLRERALDADVDPRFVIADEISGEMMLEEALAATVDSLEPDERESIVGMAGGEDYLVALYRAARATPHAIADLSPVDADLADLRERSRAFLDECASQTAKGKTAERLEGLKALAPRLLASEPEPEAAEEFSVLVSGNVAAAQRELFKEGRALRTEWQAMRYRDEARAVGESVRTTLVSLDEQYTARKEAEGLLDFADLERIGLRLLRGPAGDAVGREYDHLLVDEYQDTSRIQQAILDQLAVRCERFGVGDAKQSIYRFRFADAGVFRELQDEADTYPLRGSFRSRPELVKFNNELFQTLFEDSDVESQDLVAAANWPDKETASVELLVARGERASQARRAEAAAIARRLRELVEGGDLAIGNAEADDDHERETLGYRHCALLLRATTHLGVYERALADEGVPYVVVKGRGYYAAREVVDLAHLLLLLGDPHDDFRAVAAMTSLFCGVTEGVIVRLRDGEGPLPWRVRGMQRPATIDGSAWRRLQLFADRFDRWRSLASRIDTGDLIEAIFNETHFADLMLLEPDGRRRHANLHKALRRARQSAEDPESFARSLLEFRERERRESEAPIAAETDEAVKIMTVHASKGLEFPLVAIADLTATPKGGHGPILRPDGLFGFRLRGDDGGIDPPGMAALKEWESQQEDNERLRLLYVALTRAEEHLLLGAPIYPKCHTKYIDPLLDDPPAAMSVVETGGRVRPGASRRAAAAVRAAIRRAAPLPPSLPRDETGADELLRRIAGSRLPDSDATPYVAAVADLVEYQRCPRRYRLGRMLGLEVEGEWEEGGERGEHRNSDEHPRRLLGTVFHEIMAGIGPGAVPDDACIDKHMPEATDTDRAKLVEWSEWLAGTELTQRLQASETLKPELPFLVSIAGLPIRGVIDLYAPDLPLLLDYKTGGSVRADEYGVQVAIYLAALRALGYNAPDRAHLVYVDAQQIIEVEEQPIEPLVDAFRAAHRGEMRFDPVPGGACRYCDFRVACVANGVECPER